MDIRKECSAYPCACTPLLAVCPNRTVIPQRVRMTLLRVAAGWNDKDHQVIGAAAAAAVVGTNIDLAAILLLEMLVSKN